MALPSDPPTCPAPAWYKLDFFPRPSAQTLKAGRPDIIAFAARSDAFVACLKESLTLLRARWAQAGQSPNATVEAAVENAIANWTFYRERAVDQFEDAVTTQSQTVAGVQANSAVSPIEPREIAALAVPAFPGSADLNLPSYAMGRTRDCSSYYPDDSRRANESGQVTVGYDVGADGAILNPHITTSAGFQRLDDAAMACVTAKWRSLPALHAGIPSASPGHEAVLRFSIW